MVGFFNSASVPRFDDIDRIAEWQKRIPERVESVANSFGDDAGIVSASRYIPEYTAEYWGLSRPAPKRRAATCQLAIACNARSPALPSGVESATEGAAS